MWRLCQILLTIVICGPAFGRSAFGKTWSVVVDGSTGPSVQAYIDASSNGDTVLVSPGHYFENLDFKGKAIVLLSTSGADQTILDGSSKPAPVIMCASGEPSSTIIQGFTITGGYGYAYFGNNSTMGGGIFCFHSQPQILDNIITNNRADLPQFGAAWGGGLLVAGAADEAPIIIRGNTITENHTSANAGGAWIEAPCVFEDNLVQGNSTGGGDGAGLYLVREKIDIINNRFLGNVAGDHGGAIYSNDAHATISGNLFVGNTSNTTVADDCSGGAMWLYGDVHVTHNTIAFNEAENLNPPAAGGICVTKGYPDQVIEYNIITANTGGGVVGTSGYVSGTSPDVLLSRNIIFNNSPEDVHSSSAIKITESEDVYADPFLCTIGSTSDGTVSSNSPALTQLFGSIGAFETPGCGAMDVRRSTWGSLKARY